MTTNSQRLLYIIIIIGVLVIGFVTIKILIGNKTEVTYSVYPIGEEAEQEGEQGWGYDIAIDGKVKIHQPFIPALEGMRPFADKESAEKMARFVARKVESGEYPAVTKAEVDSLLKH